MPNLVDVAYAQTGKSTSVDNLELNKLYNQGFKTPLTLETNNVSQPTELQPHYNRIKTRH